MSFQNPVIIPGQAAATAESLRNACDTPVITRPSPIFAAIARPVPNGARAAVSAWGPKFCAASSDRNSDTVSAIRAGALGAQKGAA